MQEARRFFLGKGIQQELGHTEIVMSCNLQIHGGPFDDSNRMTELFDELRFVGRLQRVLPRVGIEQQMPSEDLGRLSGP